MPKDVFSIWNAGRGYSNQHRNFRDTIFIDYSIRRDTLARIRLALDECRSDSDRLTPRKPKKEPAKECRIAYELHRLRSFKQAEVAEMMNRQGLKAPKGGKIKPYHVSRWVSDWAKWLEFQILPVERSAPRAGRTVTNHDVIEQGARTDGRKPKKRRF